MLCKRKYNPQHDDFVLLIARCPRYALAYRVSNVRPTPCCPGYTGPDCSDRKLLHYAIYSGSTNCVKLRSTEETYTADRILFE